MIDRADKTYTDCLKQQSFKLYKSQEAADVVTSAILAGCQVEYAGFQSVFYRYSGNSIASDSWIRDYSNARRQEVLNAVIRMRLGEFPQGFKKDDS